MAYGTIVQVIGPTVDIRFAPEELPSLQNAILIEDKEKNTKLTLEVAQHIGDNTVRCVAMASTDGLVRGMKAKDLGAPISVPVGEQTLGRIFNLLGEPIDEKGKLPNPEKRYPIHRPAPKYEDLLPVSNTLETESRCLTFLRLTPKAVKSVFSAARAWAKPLS